MEQSHSCETEPPEIRRRLESIQRQRALIEDLATRLKAAQLEHDRLETELNKYRYSIAPIRKCPEEVLLMIFESFAEAAPELVTDLLQVCERWRDIAANAPRLWTHINIKVKPTWNQCEAARKDAKMIKTYLQHSATLPLHINVDLRKMLDEESQIEGFLNGLMAIRCTNDICGEVRRFVFKLEGRRSEDPVPCFSESYGPEEVLNTIETLVGSSGEHMHRWKSARILLPRNGRDIREIWTLFSGRTPQLTELLVSGNKLSRESLVAYKHIPDIFPDLSSLEALTLQGTVKDFKFLGLTFPSVKRLDLAMDISVSSQLSLFTSLEYLDVLFVSTQVTGAIIRLPLLRGLAIHLQESITVEWHVPVIQRLEIVAPYEDLVTTLPDVQALKVEWRLGKTGYVAEDESNLLCTLEAIMSQYRDMQKLTIQALLRPIWENYVEQLGEEKRLDLPTITFY
jgi:hypothetical protein